MIPLNVEALYEVVVLDDAAPFELVGTAVRTFQPGGIVYYRSDVDSTVLGATPLTAATLLLLTDGLAMWGVDAFAGKWVEILDGPAVGDIRQIRNNTATTLVPVAQFTAAPVVGNTFRIFEPSTEIRESVFNAIIALQGATSGQNSSASAGLFFERFFIRDELRIVNRVHLSICKTDHQIGNRTNPEALLRASLLLAGSEPKAAALIHVGLSTNAYRGAGVLIVTPANGISVSCIGYLCAIGVAVTVQAGNGYLRGGRFNAGLTLDGVFDQTQWILAADSSMQITISLSKLSVIRGAVAELEGVTVLAAAGNALVINTAGRVVVGNTCSFTASVATAVIVETQGLLIPLQATPIVAGGGAAGFGILARRGGTVRMTGLPTVTGGTAGVNDFAVGEVPTLGASALFAAAGVALLPAVVLDGSVVQRVA